MDGVFEPFDALDQEAASGLVSLSDLDKDNSSLESTKTPVVSRTASDNVEHAEDVSPPSSQQSSANTTPVREFKLAGMKRERDQTYTIFYSTGTEQIGVPYSPGEGADKLFERRDEAARRLFSINRGDAFCSWRSTVISLILKDARWTKFRHSNQQERYNYKAIQLVITRYTCTQWRNVKDPCRNCENRNWRTACQRPTFLMHIMPLPVYRQEKELCEQCLSELEPIDTDLDKKDWVQRMPQINVR